MKHEHTTEACPSCAENNATIQYAAGILEKVTADAEARFPLEPGKQSRMIAIVLGFFNGVLQNVVAHEPGALEDMAHAAMLARESTVIEIIRETRQ